MIDTQSGQLLMHTEAAASNVSLWSLFSNADWVVQGIIFVLLLASFWTWSLIFMKMIEFYKMQKLTQKFEKAFWAERSLGRLLQEVGPHPKEPLAQLFCLGMREWQASQKNPVPASDSMEWVERLLFGKRRDIEDKLSEGVHFLATVGATAPFVGLFGTVWGIMHSFQSIAACKNTSLTVVAPGIAEALFATAMGLIAAIPAVIAYNKIQQKIQAYAVRMEGFIDNFIYTLTHTDTKGD